MTGSGRAGFCHPAAPTLSLQASGGGLPLGESPTYCQQFSSVLCPSVLVYETRPAFSTLPRSALLIFKSEEVGSLCCPYPHPALVCFCPETCLQSHSIQLVSTGGTAAPWHHWNQPSDCTWHLGDFLGPVAWTSRVHQRGDVKVFPRFWWAFLRDKVSKWSTRQPSMSSCIVVWVLWECICSRINSKYYW